MVPRARISFTVCFQTLTASADRCLGSGGRTSAYTWASCLPSSARTFNCSRLRCPGLPFRVICVIVALGSPIVLASLPIHFLLTHTVDRPLTSQTSAKLAHG